MEKINVVKLSIFSLALAISCVAIAFAVTRIDEQTPDAFEVFEAERQLIIDKLVPERDAILLQLAAKEQDIADAEIRLCIAGLKLAQAKLTDHFNSVKMLDSGEVQRLTEKLSIDCGTPLGVEPLPKFEAVSYSNYSNNSKKSSSSTAYADSIYPESPDSSKLEFGAKLSQVIEDQKGQLDLDKLAYAVAMAETGNCTEGMGVTRNNCFGIKNGSIAPCEKKSANNFCIYNAPSESYAAFRAIWLKGYGGKFPTLKAADVWTGGDAPHTWLKNVTHYYNL